MYSELKQRRECFMSGGSIRFVNRSESIYIWPIWVVSFFCYCFVYFDQDVERAKIFAATIFFTFLLPTIFVALVKLEEFITLLLLLSFLALILFLQFLLGKELFEQWFFFLSSVELDLSKNVYVIVGLFFVFIQIAGRIRDGRESVIISDSQVVVSLWTGEQRTFDASSLSIRVHPKDPLRSWLGMGARDIDFILTQGVSQETYTLRNVVGANSDLKTLNHLLR